MATYQQLFNLCKKKFNISWLYGQSHANEKLFLTEKAKQYPTLCVWLLNIIILTDFTHRAGGNRVF